MILTGEEGTFSQGVGHVARPGQVSRDSSLTLSSAFVDAGAGVLKVQMNMMEQPGCVYVTPHSVVFAEKR